MRHSVKLDRLAGALGGGAGPAGTPPGDAGSSKKQAAIYKKLKKFFEKGASLSSRFKSLMSFVEKASDEDLRKFFNEHFYMIYGVFLDTFSAYENQCKRGRHDAATLKDLLVVLKNVLVYLADYVKKGWQIRSIGEYFHLQANLFYF